MTLHEPVPIHDAVPAGYKRTEVGIIPVDWNLYTFGEIFNFLSTANNSRDHLSDSGDIAYIHYGDIHTLWDYKVDFEHAEVPFISKSKISHAALLKEGDLILVDASEDEIGIGKSIEVVNLGDRLAVAGLHTILLRPYNSIIQRIFSRYIQEISVIKMSFRKITTGLKVFGLSKKPLKDVYIPIPPIPEQHAIAEALSDVDALIDALDALIAKKRDIKLATMQQLLTAKTRLPGFSDEWDVINMSKDLSLKARIGWQGLTTKEYLVLGDYYLVTGTDFIGGRVNWDSCWSVDRNRYIQDSNIQLKINDILLTKDGTIGKSGFIDKLPKPATLNSGVFVIRPRSDKYLPLYIFYILNSEIFNSFLVKLQAGSTISHLYQKDFITFTFSVPSLEEQHAIASILSDMDAEIAALEQERAKTVDLKQGMMQQLLTGRIRLI